MIKNNTMENGVFANDFKELAEIVESWLAEAFELGLGDTLAPDTLVRACSYAVLGPGKRLRPVLVLASARLLGLDLKRLRSFALATEFIHCATLVHDDLPALDNDDLRRGRPCCHKVFGEAIGVIAGDSLFFEAFLQIAKADELNSREKAGLTGLIAQAGIDLCLGQVMDIEASAKERELQPENRRYFDPLLEQRHLKKTASLIRASVLGPTFLLEESEAARVSGNLSQFGLKLGLLFQITDDLLEATSSTEKIGKSVNSDLKQGVPTYVTCLGIEQARNLAVQQAKEAKAALSIFEEKASFLNALCDYVLERES